MLKLIINTVFQYILPSKTYLKLLILKRGFEEPELKLVYDFCDKDSISIDVGAANGMYLAHLYKLSKKTYAFEPRKKALQSLKKMFFGITSSIQFEEVALSDVSGSRNLRVLKSNDRLSTIEEENTIEKFGEVEEVKVLVKRIDDYEFTDKVSFIKIDVEGHEESVIKGALGLIKRDHPTLLIEIEDRHKKDSVNVIKTLLQELNYEGFFYMDGFLHKLDAFNIQEHHQYTKHGQPYIFNFIYLHTGSIEKFGYLLKKC